MLVILTCTVYRMSTICTLYIQLYPTPTVDNNVITETITSACNIKYLVLDQVKTNALLRTQIISSLKDRREADIRMPLIMFTSGHYSPSEKWLNLQSNDFLCYKLISMKIEEEAHVRKIKQMNCVVPIHGDCVLSDADLLSVTNCYSRMVECVDLLPFHGLGPGKDHLEAEIYPVADLYFIQRNDSTRHFIWLAWQDILSKEVPPYDRFSGEYCKLTSYHVEYLGYLISEIKDSDDRGINAILNSMEIYGKEEYERNGYTEFEHECSLYKFLNKKGLYDVLKRCVMMCEDLSQEHMYEVFRAAYEKLTMKNNPLFEYVKGGLLELIISAFCAKVKNIENNPVGMFCHFNEIIFRKVNICEPVANVDELCALPKKYHTAKEETMQFWCELSKAGKQAFKGFDFAYMETSLLNNEPVVELLQLFHVTVNPHGKSVKKLLIMTDTLDKITAVLVKQELIQLSDADRVVVPYFVQPNCLKSKKTLPCRNPDRKIDATIVCFPQPYLCKQK